MPNQLPLSPARGWHMSSAETIQRDFGMTVEVAEDVAKEMGAKAMPVETT